MTTCMTFHIPGIKPTSLTVYITMDLLGICVTHCANCPDCSTLLKAFRDAITDRVRSPRWDRFMDKDWFITDAPIAWNDPNAIASHLTKLTGFTVTIVNS